MLTRCPSCATTFRVSPSQLKARQGRVRCGKCRNVFNALETLIEEAPQLTPAIAEPPTQALPAPEPEPAAPPAPAAAASAPSPAPPPEPSDETAVPPAPTFSEPAPPEPLPPAKHAPKPAAPVAEEDTEPETLVDYEPAFASLLVEAPRRRAWPWVLGSLLALCALALQAAIHFRETLAVMAPEAKPALKLLCSYAGCDLTLPRKVDLVAIESSDLHPDPAGQGRLQLVATLRNRAGFAQEYPHLELTLTDTLDKALLRRALAPADYLPKDAPVAAGFAANSELSISLSLVVKDLAPVGYRLYVFYP